MARPQRPQMVMMHPSLIVAVLEVDASIYPSSKL